MPGRSPVDTRAKLPRVPRTGRHRQRLAGFSEMSAARMATLWTQSRRPHPVHLGAPDGEQPQVASRLTLSVACGTLIPWSPLLPCPLEPRCPSWQPEPPPGGTPLLLPGLAELLLLRTPSLSSVAPPSAPCRHPQCPEPTLASLGCPELPLQALLSVTPSPVPLHSWEATSQLLGAPAPQPHLGGGPPLNAGFSSDFAFIFWATSFMFRIPIDPTPTPPAGSSFLRDGHDCELNHDSPKFMLKS